MKGRTGGTRYKLLKNLNKRSKYYSRTGRKEVGVATEEVSIARLMWYYDNLADVMKELNVGVRELSRVARVTAPTIMFWRKKLRSPHIATFARCVSYLEGLYRKMGGLPEGAEGVEEDSAPHAALVIDEVAPTMSAEEIEAQTPSAPKGDGYAEVPVEVFCDGVKHWEEDDGFKVNERGCDCAAS